MGYGRGNLSPANLYYKNKETNPIATKNNYIKHSCKVPFEKKGGKYWYK